jgi:hypothetical protein
MSVDSGNDLNATTPAPEGKAPDLAKVVESLTVKHGDGNAALRVLVSENYAYRDQLRELKAKLPADGQRVLTADEAKAYETYRSFGKPEDVRRIKDEHGSLTSENYGYKRDTELRTVAEKTGVKFTVLKTLAGTLDFTATVKVKDKTGKETEVPAIKDGESDPVPFDEYATTHWSDFLPALRASAESPLATLTTPSRRQAAPLPPASRQAETPADMGIRIPRF